MLGCKASRWNRNRTNFYSSFICTAFPASNQSDCWTSRTAFHQEKVIFLWHSRHQHHIVNQTLLVALITIILLAILNFVCNDIPSFTAFFSFLRHLGPISRRRSLLVFVSRVRDQRLASRVELLVEGTHRWFPWKSSTFTWLEMFTPLLPQTTCLVSHLTDQQHTCIHTHGQMCRMTDGCRTHCVCERICFLFSPAAAIDARMFREATQTDKVKSTVHCTCTSQHIV